MKNTKILLIGINAKYIHSNPAIYSLKAYADKYCTDRPDHSEIHIAEYTINQPYENIIADIYLKRPRVAAFSCYVWNWNVVQDIITELPKLLPDTDIWLGGPEVSFDADRIIEKYSQLAGIMVGEGEEAFLELVRHYWNGTPRLSDIKGLVLREGFTGERMLTDINKLPFIYDSLDAFENRIIYYEAQRGCLFRCAYCLSSIDKQLRQRDIETVKAELQFFLESKVKQVKFIDRTFNCNADYALWIWEYLRDNDNDVTNFHFEIAADLLTAKQLEVMKSMRPGLIQLEIGVQSTNAMTLDAINRHMDINALRVNVAKIKSFNNIHQHLDLIAGLPYEDYDTFVTSFNDVYDMKPEQLQLGFLKVLKGSPMEERAAEYGIVYGTKPPYEALYTKWLSFNDVLRLKGVEEMVELYYNSGQFAHILPVLVNEFESPFKMFEELADYYRKNGYFINAPARAYRYQVLLDFACYISPKKKQLFVELLVFDMYLRENLKSRPAFAPSDNLKRERLCEFFEREAAEHRYLKGYDGYSPAQLARMTHIESFSFYAWSDEPLKCAAKLDKAAYVLFDYRNRDILTNNANWWIVKL